MSSPPPSHGEGWLTKLSPPSGHPSPRVAIPLHGTLNLSTSRYVPLLRRVLLPWVPSRYRTSCNSRGTIPRVTLVVLYLGYLSRYNTSCNPRDMLLPWDARRVCPVKSAASKCDWQGNCPWPPVYGDSVTQSLSLWCPQCHRFTSTGRLSPPLVETFLLPIVVLGTVVEGATVKNCWSLSRALFDPPSRASSSPPHGRYFVSSLTSPPPSHGEGWLTLEDFLATLLLQGEGSFTEPGSWFLQP